MVGPHLSHTGEAALASPMRSCTGPWWRSGCDTGSPPTPQPPQAARPHARLSVQAPRSFHRGLHTGLSSLLTPAASVSPRALGPPPGGGLRAGAEGAGSMYAVRRLEAVVSPPRLLPVPQGPWRAAVLTRLCPLGLPQVLRA